MNGGCRDVAVVTQYREQSSPTNVDWVPFLELKPQLDEFVVCSLSCSEHLSSGTPVFLPPQKCSLIDVSMTPCHHFQFRIKRQ